MLQKKQKGLISHGEDKHSLNLRWCELCNWWDLEMMLQRPLLDKMHWFHVKNYPTGKLQKLKYDRQSSAKHLLLGSLSERDISEVNWLWADFAIWSVGGTQSPAWDEGLRRIQNQISHLTASSKLSSASQTSFLTPTISSKNDSVEQVGGTGEFTPTAILWR